MVALGTAKMPPTLPWKPWHHVVTLREDLRTGELALNQFAADLYEVMMQSGKRPILYLGGGGDERPPRG